MVCPLYKSIRNGICDEANNKYVCQYDGGDCSKDNHNCASQKCAVDPCPEYELIGNGHCNAENYNFICSFDGGDCQMG